MIREELHLSESELKAELLPRLIGHVFQVTSAERFERIRAAGAVLPNSDGSLGNTYPQSAISLARKNGYVCLFDLRNKSSREIQFGLESFYFLAPRALGEDIVFLIVSAQYYDHLIQWEDISHRVEIGAFHIPYVECWHDGALPIATVGRVLVLHVTRRPIGEDSLAFLSALANRKSEPA